MSRFGTRTTNWFRCMSDTSTAPLMAGRARAAGGWRIMVWLAMMTMRGRERPADLRIGRGSFVICDVPAQISAFRLLIFERNAATIAAYGGCRRLWVAPDRRPRKSPQASPGGFFP